MRSSAKRTNQAPEVSSQGGLGAPQEEFQGLPIPGLRPQHPESFFVGHQSVSYYRRDRLRRNGSVAAQRSRRVWPSTISLGAVQVAAAKGARVASAGQASWADVDRVEAAILPVDSLMTL